MVPGVSKVLAGLIIFGTERVYFVDGFPSTIYIYITRKMKDLKVKISKVVAKPRRPQSG